MSVWVRRFLVFVLAFLLGFHSLAQNEKSKGNTPALTATVADNQHNDRTFLGDWTPSGYLEMRSWTSSLKKRHPERINEINELSIEIDGALLPSWNVTFEGAAEKWEEEESVFFLKRAFVQGEEGWGSVRVGQFFYPIGHLNGQFEHRVVHHPLFYQRILPFRKTIGLGFQGRARIGYGFFLEAGVMDGRFVRPADRRSQSAETPPSWMKMGWASPAWGDYQFEAFQQHLGFMDPQRGWGITWRTVPWEVPYWTSVSWEIMGEAWRLQEGDYPVQVSRAAYVFPRVSWKSFKLGAMWESLKTEIPGLSRGVSRSGSFTWQIGWDWGDHFQLRFEKNATNENGVGETRQVLRLIALF